MRKRKNFILGSLGISLLLSLSSQTLQARERSAFQELPCSADALTLSVKSNPNDPKGLSHNTADLIITNTRSVKCTITTRPEISFLNTSRHPLPISFKTENLYGTQSALKEITLPENGQAKLSLRWVSQRLFNKNSCYKSAYLALITQGKESRIVFKNKLCGEKANGVIYEASLLTPISK